MENIRFTHLTPEDGLAQIIVGTILRDCRGFMWFGTRGGLNRYDGYDFELFENETDDPHSLSSNSIYCLYEDRSGNLWIGTPNGLNKFDHLTNRFTAYKYDPDNPQSTGGNIVWSICEDSAGSLWIGTHDGGLSRFDRETKRFVRIRHNPRNPFSLSSNLVETIFEDSKGTLWIGTAEGLNKLVPGKKGPVFTCYRHDPADSSSLSGDHIRSIYEDHKGVLWVGTRYKGLNAFDRDSGRSIRFEHDPNDPDSLGQGPVWTICEDRDHILWIGCYGGGLCRFDRENNRFIRYVHDPANPHSLCGNMIEAIYEDNLGVLWIGTWDNGVSKYDRSAEKFKLYSHDPGNPNGLSDRFVRSICEDPQSPGRVFWIGTQSGGLNRFDKLANTWAHFRYYPNKPGSLSSDSVTSIFADSQGVLWVGTMNGGLNRLNPEAMTFRTYKHDPDNKNSLNNDHIRSIAECPEGVLWLGTNNGLNKFDVKNNKFTRFIHDPSDANSVGSGFCLFIHPDKSGILWIGHRGGGLGRFDPQKGTFTRYLYDPANPDSINDNEVWSIYEDAAGILWLGTSKGLNKFDPKARAFSHYRKKDGLPSDAIAGILEDNRGNLWLGTRGGGLSKFDPKAETFKNFDSSDGLQSSEFPENWVCKSKTGELFFGGIKGLNSFYPEEIKDSAFVPPVVLTDFKIFNKSAVIVAKKSPLTRVINETEHLELSYNDSVFSFEFSALNYRSPEKNRYKYIMENFEKEWNYVDHTRRFANYTNLPPGEYVFRVKASNNDGVWNETGKSIKIKILPPWWQAWWARIFAFLFVSGSIFSIYKVRTNSLRKRSKELHEINKALNKEILERKLLEKKLVRQERLAVLGELAGGIAHELRNPLGAIKNSVYFLNMMLEDAEGEMKESLQILNNEIESSERIISSLLDYARNKPPDKRRIPVAGNINDLLSQLKIPGNITINNRVSEVLPDIMADPLQLGQVFANIILNAFQAMPEGGQVTIHGAIENPGWISISIRDTGIGIPEDKINRIFEPLFSTKAKGIGLGMSISRTFLKGHGGKIEVQSEPGKGTTVTVKLPVRLQEEDR